MTKDMDDILVDNKDLTEQQKKLLLLRDYFELLKSGIVQQGDGWEEEKITPFTWLDVFTTELESEVIQIEEEGKERSCRWDEPKDLTEYAINIDSN